MNINMSPPRSGFMVLPHEKLLAMVSPIKIRSLSSSASSALSASSSSSPLLRRNTNRSIKEKFLLVDSKKNHNNTSASPVLKKAKNGECCSYSRKDTTTVRVLVPIIKQQSSSSSSRSHWSTVFDDEEDGTTSSRSRITSIRFQIDENGSIAKDYATSPHNCYLTKDDIANCWWTKKELMAIKKRETDICRHYLASRPDYRMAAFRMMQRCGAEHAKYIPEHFIANNLPLHDEDDDMDLLIGNDESRGLEKRLFNAMHLPFHRYKRCVSTVIHTQERLRTVSTKTEYFSYSKQSRLIAAHYQQHCQYAVIWARKVAQTDAAEVSSTQRMTASV